MDMRLPETKSLEDYIPEPRSIEDTELTIGFLADLALKLIYYKNDMTSAEIADALALPFLGVMERVLPFLKRQELVTITGSKGFGEVGYQWSITGNGIRNAVQAFERDRYVGPAPVSLERYNAMIRRQSMGSLKVEEDDVRGALSHLVLNGHLVDRLGPAVNSGRSLFLYGPAGNGKTIIAKSIIRMLKGHVYIPHAVTVDGQIIRVFDTVSHQRVDDPPQSTQRLTTTHIDRRWVKIRRPEIIVGGELVLQSLDLIFDPVSRTYDAPFQMKANTGLFVIDDFGRQRIRPQDLLNRWIVPLESGTDYLTLQTGKKIEVPFDVLIIFATNLNPHDLVDEAFLRRIRHKLRVDYPDQGTFYEIMERECAARDIELSRETFDYLIQRYYLGAHRELRSCHPRDLLDCISDIATYQGVRPSLSRQLIDAACDTYFSDIQH